jgi:RNA polymerase sigma-70 factor (ECF subfamily)
LVTATLAGLPDRERWLLHKHAIYRSGIDELAHLLRMHRAPAARWVEAARQAVVEGVRGELVRRLQLTRGELDSILRLISSQLDVSLPRLLGR